MFSRKPRTVMLSVRGIPSYHVFFGCEASQVNLKIYQSVLSNTLGVSVLKSSAFIKIRCTLGVPS